jgi:rare lipoprotein A
MPPSRSRHVALLVAVAIVLVSVACGRDRGATVDSAGGVDALVAGDSALEVVDGLASYYGTILDGERTASGERLDARDERVAAHPGWPFGSVARVTAKETGEQVIVRIIDRGPAEQYLAEGVVIDLSVAAARALAMRKDGRIPVRVEVLSWGTGDRVPADSTAR